MHMTTFQRPLASFCLLTPLSHHFWFEGAGFLSQTLHWKLTRPLLKRSLAGWHTVSVLYVILKRQLKTSRELFPDGFFFLFFCCLFVTVVQSGNFRVKYRLCVTLWWIIRYQETWQQLIVFKSFVSLPVPHSCFSDGIREAGWNNFKAT